MDPKSPPLDDKLDEALEDTFPASDPPAVFGDDPEERETEDDDEA